jgi:molybdopterin molybdotransferase
MGRMLGLAEERLTLDRARLATDLGPNNFREDFIRAKLSRDDTGAPLATPFKLQDSSMMSTLAASDCLINRPPNAPAIKAGEWVPVVML